MRVAARRQIWAAARRQLRVATSHRQHGGAAPVTPAAATPHGRSAAAPGVFVDHCSMVGPVPYMARVPLQQVLPHEYLDAEGELRRYADEFDSHPVATDRGTWHWYPEHRTRPAHIPGQTFYLLI